MKTFRILICFGIKLYTMLRHARIIRMAMGKNWVQWACYARSISSLVYLKFRMNLHVLVSLI